MRSVDAWEVLGLKVFCLLMMVASALGFFYEVLHPSDLIVVRILQFGGPALMLSASLAAFILVNPQRYIRCVLTAIVFTTLGLWMLILTDAVAYRAGPNDDLPLGRFFEHVFLFFPAFAILGLFLVRLWAVLLWVGLMLVQPIVFLWVATSFDHIYFTYDLALLAVDGNAINRDILEKYRNVEVLFVSALIGLTLFHRWALKSSVTLEKSKENYRRFFSPEIGDEIEAGDIVVGREGSKRVEVAVLFTDIVGFTKLSEEMDPADVLDLLSAYQTLMVEAIFDCSGTVDKFIGDAVMANFGAPRSHGNDAQNAFECGLLMNSRLAAWNAERTKSGQQPVEHRIGIHFGQCVVGNMGSDQRLEYAVIGDVVNVASRICDACKNFDTNFLISSALHDRIDSHVPSELAESIKIRGRERPIDLIKIYI